MAVRYRTLQDRLDELEAEKKDANEELAQLRQGLVSEMEASDLTSFNLAEVGTVYLTAVFYVRANKEREDELISWLDKHKQGELAKRRIHWGSLQAAYKDWIAENQPVPGPEMVEVKTGREARLRR